MPKQQFIRHILIIGEQGKCLDEMTKQLRALSKKIRSDKIIDRQLLSSALANHFIDGAFLCSDHIAEIKYALRLLGMYMMKTNSDLKLFFTSSNFETFQQILSDTDLEKVTVIPWPIDYKEISSQFIGEIFDQNLSKKITMANKEQVEIDLEFIDVFIQATKKTIEEMGGVSQIDHARPELRRNEMIKLEEGISSKITISSDFFSGYFYVIFPKDTFLNLYEKTVGEKALEVNDENSDFAGELANIIYGQSKKVFSASGLNLDMVIPSIELSTSLNEEFVILTPFSCSIGKFYIAVIPSTL